MGKRRWLGGQDRQEEIGKTRGCWERETTSYKLDRETRRWKWKREDRRTKVHKTEEPARFKTWNGRDSGELASEESKSGNSNK